MARKKKSSVFEKVEAEVMEAAGDYVKKKVVRRFVKIGEFSVLALLALILISIGIAQLIGFYYPQFDNGLNYLFLGLLLMISGFIIKA